MDSGTQPIFSEPEVLGAVDTKLNGKQVPPSESSECRAKCPKKPKDSSEVEDHGGTTDD